MTANQCAVWILILGAVLLLITLGKLDLLLVLLPLSLLLAYGIGCAGDDQSRLTDRIKKR